MRLSEEHKAIIHTEVLKIFGATAEVWLFGSRTIDAARGGDIDLFIEASATADEALQHELALHGRLIQLLGDQRIDIVVHRRGTPLRPVDVEAKRTGILL